MILPTKRVPAQRSLLWIGGRVLRLLDEPKTVSRIWDDIQSEGTRGEFVITYDWFVLAMDLLYTLGVISLQNGRIERVSV